MRTRGRAAEPREPPAPDRDPEWAGHAPDRIMTLLAAVTASLLPLSRTRVASWCKDREVTADRLESLLTESGFTARSARDEVASCAEAAVRLIESGRSAGMAPLAAADPAYPPLLACIPDPPPVLWVRGCVDVLQRPAVAVVGSRAATEYARQVAHRLSRDLAAAGVVIVSGLARGVDAAAHIGCLEAGPTIGVLGSGLDRIYPAEHRRLAASVCEQGALVSELGPGAPPLAAHFPLRNRIISGISLAVVVVEASDKSGSLITARCGLDQGRDVMAVPGSVLSGRNAGSHRLLKDGAKVVETADDILEELGWPARPARQAGGGIEDPVLRRMAAGEEYRLEELMAATGMSGPALLVRLTALELEGQIAATATGAFSRVGRPTARKVC